MPIPDFADGYHLPSGIFECTIDEVEDKFLFSGKRKEVWEDFKYMLQKLAKLGIKPEYIYVNGSFVTGRSEPGDVDFAGLIKDGPMKRALNSAADEHDKKAILSFCNTNHADHNRDILGVHFLVASDNVIMSQWERLFRFGKGGQLRDPDPAKDPNWVKKPASKGILKIIL